MLFVTVHESAPGTKRKCFRPITLMPAIEGTADMI
jgi:hypothetical protein